MASDSRVIDRVAAATPAGRRGNRPRTIPEQIADHVGAAILRGEYAHGERIREQEMATLYGVSRGPVREAIRSLARRGLVEFLPRRGAYAIGMSLDRVADFFNLRAALLGLAARCFVRVRPQAGLAQLDDSIAALCGLAAAEAPDPVAFALQIGRAGAVLYRHCDNLYLNRVLREHVLGTLWGVIWRDQALDFMTPLRREEGIACFRRIAQAAQDGDEAEAERLARWLLLSSRDQALAVLLGSRREAIDRTKQIAPDYKF
jgi:DNA-binding GntR family transcriptional regulator